MKEKLKILNRIILEVNKADELSVLLEKILDLTLKLLKFDGGCIYLINEKQGTAEIFCHKGLPKIFIEKVKSVNIDKSYYRKVFINGQPLYTEEYQKYLQKISEQGDYLTMASIPMLSKKSVIGALNIVSKKKCVLSYEEKDILTSIGLEIGTVIARMQAEQKLKESEEKYRRIIENTLEGYFEVDLKGNLTFFNKALAKLLGYSSREILLGTNYRSYMTETSGKKTFKVFNKIYNSEIPHKSFQYGIRRKDGKVLYGESSLYLRYDSNGNKIGFSGIVRDITEKKEAELRLKKSETRFRRAYEREHFYKDLFAHNMKNILHGILMSLELCELNLKALHDDPKIQESFFQVEHQIERGSRLIKIVRTFSELEDSSKTLKNINVIEVIKKIIEKFQLNAQERALNIKLETFSEYISIQASDMINDVFEHIMLNAIIHNDYENIELLIQISKTRTDSENYIKFEFIDNGRGIPDNRKETIFIRSSNQEKSTTGMGLGLSLVKNILDKYGGKIWVEDRVQGDHMKGSKFIVLIPEVS